MSVRFRECRTLRRGRRNGQGRYNDDTTRAKFSQIPAGAEMITRRIRGDEEIGYWVRVPHLILEANLPAGAIALYLAIRRSASEDNEAWCYRSARTLAANSGQSAWSVAKHKRALAALGYITIEERRSRRGRQKHYIKTTPALILSDAFFSLSREDRPQLGDGCCWGLGDGGNALVEYKILGDAKFEPVRTVMVIR